MSFVRGPDILARRQTSASNIITNRSTQTKCIFSRKYIKGLELQESLCDSEWLFTSVKACLITDHETRVTDEEREKHNIMQNKASQDEVSDKRVLLLWRICKTD